MLSSGGGMDCFASPAMTALGYHLRERGGSIYISNINVMERALFCMGAH